LHRQPKILPPNFGSANGLPNILSPLAGKVLAKRGGRSGAACERKLAVKECCEKQEAQSTGRRMKKDEQK